MTPAFHTHLNRACQICALFIISAVGVADLKTSAPHASSQTAPPAKNKPSTKAELRRQKALTMEMIDPYAAWLWFEVGDIATREEVSVFKRLTTDDEREEFIEQFWERRNPEPRSLENRFKIDLYRRRVSANERFSTATPGWRTDLGRIYAKFGPPDTIEKYPHGGRMNWSGTPNDGTTVTNPFERWFYRSMAGFGLNRVLIFLDSASTGDYRLVMLPSDEDLILHDPRHDRELPGGPIVLPEPLLKPSHPPLPAKFPDLRTMVRSGQPPPNPIPLLVQTSAFAATNETDLAYVAVQLPTCDLQFQNDAGVTHAQVDVYGEVQSMGGHIVNAFEKALIVDRSQSATEDSESTKFVFEEFLPLGPGRYRLKLAIKDASSSRSAMIAAEVTLPNLGNYRLTASPLILAGSVTPSIPLANELEPFVIGETKVLPNPGKVFSTGSTLGVYQQVYGLGLDHDTHKPNFHVDYEILKDGKPVVHEVEDAAHMAEASTQFTIARYIPLKDLQPGTYTLQIDIADNVAKQTITPSVIFTIR